MVYKLKITPEAEADIDGIKDYISTRFLSEQALKNTLGGTKDTINKLRDFPEIGIDVSERLNKTYSEKHKLRMLVAGSYFIFYVQENEWVSILRVLYQKRDWTNLF